MGEEIPEFPGLIKEVKKHKASIISSSNKEKWRNTFNKMNEKRLSIVADEAEHDLAPTNEILPCKNTTFTTGN